MKNYYSTVDNIVMTFSNIEEKNGFDEITIYFERPNDNTSIYKPPLLKIQHPFIA